MPSNLQVLTEHAPTKLCKSFAHDVQQGLDSKLKYIPSTYLYDEDGSRIFQEIMDMPEYYLTDCETEILKNHKEDILSYIGKRPFRLIELGAGDGRKTHILLDFFQNAKADFEYVPVDISQGAMLGLLDSIKNNFPNLKTKGMICEYEQALKILGGGDTLNVVLFLGSSLGNFNADQARHFCRQLNSCLSLEDLLLLGMDLVKDPDILFQAYNDPQGITKRFNLNLLKRMNKDLDSCFDTNLFHHHVTYDPIQQAVKSYLLSQKKQSIRIKKLDQEFPFEAWEPIHTEDSWKYNFKDIKEIAKQSNFNVLHSFTDHRSYFTNTLWQAS